MQLKKMPNGKFLVRVCKRINGVKREPSAVFETQKEARAWGIRMQLKLDEMGQNKTVLLDNDLDALYSRIDGYIDEELRGKPSRVQDINRLNHLKSLFADHQEMLFLGKRPHQITKDDVREFIRFRKREIKGETIRKELNQLSQVFRSYPEAEEMVNPFRAVARPAPSASRTQRVKKPMEMVLLRHFKRFSRNKITRFPIVIATETAMRLGELFTIIWDQVNLDERTIHLSKTKNGSERTIPLTRRATRYLKLLKKINTQKAKTKNPQANITYQPVFGMNREQFRGIWTRGMTALKKTNPEYGDVRFHDLRHEATSRLFEKGLSSAEVQLITGHKTLSMLNRYTHLDARNLVGKIG